MYAAPLRISVSHQVRMLMSDLVGDGDSPCGNCSVGCMTLHLATFSVCFDCELMLWLPSIGSGQGMQISPQDQPPTSKAS